MDEFLAPFWNLDQVFGWAETRDPRLSARRPCPDTTVPSNSLHIAILSTQVATARMYDGRDIGGELWAASGWKPRISPFIPPPMLARYAEKRGVPAFRLYRYKDLRSRSHSTQNANALLTHGKLPMRQIEQRSPRFFVNSKLMRQSVPDSAKLEKLSSICGTNSSRG